MEDAILYMYGFIAIVIAIAAFLLRRNNKVYKLRIRVLDAEYRLIKSKGFATSYYGYPIYCSLPEYHEMVLSIKPLKLESYLTKEQIEELKSAEK